MTHPDPHLDPERGTVDVLLGALTGATVLPFLQAMAKQGGEDVYRKIKHTLSRKDRRRLKRELKGSGMVTLTIPDERLVLRLPPMMPAAVFEELAQVRIPVRRDEWLCISRDHQTSRWVVVSCDSPDEASS